MDYSFLSTIRDFLAARAHLAQSDAAVDSAAEGAEAGPRPGAVGLALLAIDSRAFALARGRPSARPPPTSHADVCKLEKPG